MKNREHWKQSPAERLGNKTNNAARLKEIIHKSVDTSLDGTSVRHWTITAPRELDGFPIAIAHHANFNQGILFIPPQIATEKEVALTKSKIIGFLEWHWINPRKIHGIIHIQLINEGETIRFWKLTHKA
jgi:hypothetical protein